MAEEKKEDYWKLLARKQKEEMDRLKRKSPKGNDVWPIMAIILSIFLVAAIFGAGYFAMQYSNVNSSYQSLKNSFETLEGQKDSFLLENENLTGQINTLNTTVTNLQNEKSQLSSQITDLEEDLDDAEKEKEEKDAEIEDLNTEIAALNNSIDRYEVWIEQYKATIDALNEQLGKTTEDISDLEDILAQCVGCGICCVDIEAVGDPVYNAGTNSTTQYYDLYICFDTDCTTCGTCGSYCTGPCCDPCYCYPYFCCPYIRVRLRVVYDLDTDTFSTTILSWYWYH
ncbi:MAG: hypothetical protein KAT49_07670 [Methanomicrobia archaeon]|nr:hypothetical protein [Methanomicrobia archaeon]